MARLAETVANIAKELAAAGVEGEVALDLDVAVGNGGEILVPEAGAPSSGKIAFGIVVDVERDTPRPLVVH